MKKEWKRLFSAETLPRDAKKDLDKPAMESCILQLCECQHSFEYRQSLTYRPAETEAETI